MAHGDLVDSIRYHLFGPILFLGILLGFVESCVEAISGQKVLPQIRKGLWQPVLATMAIAWLIYWVVRLATE
jgi:hypothetical protein